MPRRLDWEPDRIGHVASMIESTAGHQLAGTERGRAGVARRQPSRCSQPSRAGTPTTLARCRRKVYAPRGRCELGGSAASRPAAADCSAATISSAPTLGLDLWEHRARANITASWRVCELDRVVSLAVRARRRRCARTRMGSACSAQPPATATTAKSAARPYHGVIIRSSVHTFVRFEPAPGSQTPTNALVVNRDGGTLAREAPDGARSGRCDRSRVVGWPM